MNGKSSVYFTIGQELRLLYVKHNIRLLLYLVPFFLELEMVQTKVVEKIGKRTHILRSGFLSKIVPFVR